ncbi:Secreted peptide [Phytophthora megakarya]|uniref:Secreted peptide n=1 Tax=Phytophthora megakarya TaxID=4795 RepID=A0A225WV41_9STRA|nr:Secreted peptide [Phytophthora megakarya]
MTQQLRITLRLACVKSLTEDQRATMAAAVIIPKMMFVFRHAWPSTEWLRQLQRSINNFVWFGGFERDKPGGRAWIAVDIAMLLRRDGGMAVPDIRAECMALAATEVARWATTSDSTMAVIGSILLDDVNVFHSGIYITVNHVPGTER